MDEQQLAERQARIDENMRKHKEAIRRWQAPIRRQNSGLGKWMVFLCVAFPVGGVWMFNSPSFQEYAQYLMGETETPKQREDRQRNEAAMKKFTAEMKAARRREEHAKFLREQMAFEEARRERERHKI